MHVGGNHPGQQYRYQLQETLGYFHSSKDKKYCDNRNDWKVLVDSTVAVGGISHDGPKASLWPPAILINHILNI